MAFVSYFLNLELHYILSKLFCNQFSGERSHLVNQYFMCPPVFLSQCLTWPSPDLSFGTESSLLLGKMLSLLYDCQEASKSCPLDGHFSCVLSAQGSISNGPTLLVTRAHNQEVLLASACCSRLLYQGRPSRSPCAPKKTDDTVS